jgi:hypothetical protein
VRAGGGPDKGFGWERDLCRTLSLWLSGGVHTDLFERNVSSGGAFTAAAARGKKRGVPGDLMSVHPLSYEFLVHYSVEAKFWKDLFLDRALWNHEENLCRVIRQQEEIAAQSGRIFLLMAKQNRRHPLLLLPAQAGLAVFVTAIPDLHHHILWGNRILVCRLDHALGADPNLIMQLTRDFRG